MAYIAIIDDKVNPVYIKKASDIISYKVKGSSVMMDEPDLGETITHATWCMHILEKFTQNYSLINIQIMDNFRESVSIEKLYRALCFCMEVKVDIICLSVGSVFLEDYFQICDVIRLLKKKGIVVVAAESNEMYMTVPAACKEVIGVRCDRNNRLPVGEIGYLENDILGCQYIVNCNFCESLGNQRCYQSNSLSVPVIAARINNMLNDGISSAKVEQRLAEKSSIIDFKVESRSSYSRKIPAVCIITEKALSALQCQNMIKCMQKSYGYAGIVICSGQGIGDVGVLEVGRYREYSAMQLAVIVEEHTTADIIIWCLTREDCFRGCRNIDADVFFTDADIDFQSYTDDMSGGGRGYEQVCKKIIDYYEIIS